MTSSRPSQYIKGWVEFYNLKFKVTPDVLIPRPETELLVDEILAFARNYQLQTTNYPTILDIGTGAGNIAISLAKNLPEARIFATDISPEALEVARQNAKSQKVDDHIIFVVSDLLSAFSDSSLTTHHSSLVIVTNLPYIPSARIPYLDPSVKDFEPTIALDGGPDGFSLYRKLFQQLALHLRGVKLIVCEIDYTHGELAANVALKFFPKAEVEVKTDLAKKQRILVIQLAALPE